MKFLFVLNDPPYGTERTYNGLRLAHAMAKKDPEAQITVFLMADAVASAKRGSEDAGRLLQPRTHAEALRNRRAQAPALRNVHGCARAVRDGSHRRCAAQFDGRTRRRNDRGKQGARVLTRRARRGPPWARRSSRCAPSHRSMHRGDDHDPATLRPGSRDHPPRPARELAAVLAARPHQRLRRRHGGAASGRWSR